MMCCKRINILDLIIYYAITVDSAGYFCFRQLVPIKRSSQLNENSLLMVISNSMSQFFLLHIPVMSSLFNSTLLVYWDKILVDFSPSFT